MPVINLLLSHVPPHVFEARYGLVLPRSEGSFVKVTSEKLLTAYGTLRGFMTAGGRPDQARAARIILKAVLGRIVNSDRILNMFRFQKWTEYEY